MPENPLEQVTAHDAAGAGRRVRAAVARHDWLLACLVLVIPNLICWALFFPGHFQADQQISIARIAGGAPSQWHSLLWGYFAFPALYLAPSYACYGLVQIALFFACASYSLRTLKRIGLISSFTPLALVMGLLPTFLLYNNLYCPDVVFAYVIMALTAMLIEIAVSRCACFARGRFVVGFVILLVIACGLRKNALLIPIGLVIVLLVSYQRHRMRVVCSILVSLVLFAGLNYSFPLLAKAEPNPSQEMLSVPTSQIAYVFARGGDVPAEALAYLSEIRTPEQWAEAYQADSADAAKDDVVMTPELLRAWVNVGLENPMLYVEAYANLMHPYWQMSSGTSLPYVAVLDFGDYDSYTLQTSEQYSGASDGYLAQFGTEKSAGWKFPAAFLGGLVTLHPPLVIDLFNLVLFNRALPLWFVVIGFALSLRRGREGVKGCLVVLMPIACIVVSLLAFSPVALMRYAMEAYYAIPFALLFLRWMLMKKEG